MPVLSLQDWGEKPNLNLRNDLPATNGLLVGDGEGGVSGEIIVDEKDMPVGFVPSPEPTPKDEKKSAKKDESNQG